MNMKRFVLFVSMLATAGFVFAGPHGSMGLGETPGSTLVQTWVAKNGATPWTEVSIEEIAALDNAKSILYQEMRYVYGAAIASYMIPGLGQFKVGDTLGGTLHLAGQLALLGGTAYGVWALLPDDLKDTSLTYDARHELAKDYLKNNFEAIAPALGVATGGMVLSMIHSIWAAKDARGQALEQVKEGEVTFEPVPLGLGFGIRMGF